ncbi:MAG: GGDEF domain-containing protein [Desulfobacterales bacterium]|nr:GGDEF domain-containing protein [Desulfobacterales bacterium]MBS3754283.1 GGDEF domain-containing protein [Desulfobacterales bacterium]
MQIPPDRQKRDLSGYVELLRDPEHAWTISEVLFPPLSQQFKPAGPGVPHLGITDAAVWVRFHLAGAPPDGWVLKVGWPYLATVKLRDLRQNSGLRVIGRSPGERSFSAWAFPAGNDTDWSVYARFVSQGMLTLPMTLYTEDAHLKHQRVRSMGYGVYYGIILAMALYNLFLFFSLRDRAYLYYVLYMFALLLYFLGLNGLTLEYLLPGRRAMDSRLTLFFLSLIFITAGVFTRKFLATKKNAPVFDRIILAFILNGLVLGGLSFFARFSLLSALFSILGTAAPFLLITVAVVVWRRGFGPARYYLLAWTIYGIGTLNFALTYSGVIGFTTLGFHSYQIGSAVESILLSFALADRIRVLRQEREEARGSERRAMDLAFRDALTGLYNSRFFRAQIGPEMQRAQNLGHPLSLVMLDVDDFKQFNDEYGHIQGDQVLAHLGDRIRAQTRDSDYACRYGGEEFAMIMPTMTGARAMEVGQRIRRDFENYVFVPRPGRKVQVTVSIGAAEYQSGILPQDFVDRADHALYWSKAAGKNTARLWQAASK